MPGLVLLENWGESEKGGLRVFWLRRLIAEARLRAGALEFPSRNSMPRKTRWQYALPCIPQTGPQETEHVIPLCLLPSA